MKQKDQTLKQLLESKCHNCDLKYEHLDKLNKKNSAKNSLVKDLHNFDELD